MIELSGKKIAEEILSELKQQVDYLIQAGSQPTLAVVIVGDDPASHIYVGHKIKACERLGIKNLDYHLPVSTSQQELEEIILMLNNDNSVNGILCQFPLPLHLDESRIIELIDPKKDIDCFHPYNLGRLAADNPTFMPVTPFGIFQILKRSGFPIEGKHVVVVGRGTTVGRPLSILMSLKGWDATVTLCHSHTKELRTICRSADIVVGAIGKAKYITADYIKKDAIVIDVGINRIDDQRTAKGYYLVGDVDYQSVKDVALAATPVPGGVGPVTIAILMYNCINATRIQSSLSMLEI